MRYFELFETPISDFETFGDFSREGSFRPDDIKAINNPKWRAKVFKSFEKTPFNFNIYLVNGDENGKVRYEVGKYAFDKFHARDLTKLGQWAGMRSPQFVQNIIKQPIKDPDTSITIVIIENEGAERVPLTPWLLGHRLCHSIDYKNDDHISRQSNMLRKEIIKFLYKFNLLRDQLRKNEPQTTLIDDNKDLVNQIAMEITTFRSGRMGNLSNSGELYIEWMTQYLIQGKVTLKYDKEMMVAVANPQEQEWIDEIREWKLNSRQFADYVIFKELKGRPQLGDNPSRQKIAKLKAYEKRYAELMEIWDSFYAKGFLKNDPKLEISLLVRQFETELNKKIEKIFQACVGKAFVL